MPMNKANWIRARAVDRPSKRKKRAFDEQNDVAAAVILEAPVRDARFLVDWAKAFTRRRAQESRKACGRVNRGKKALKGDSVMQHALMWYVMDMTRNRCLQRGGELANLEPTDVPF